MRLGFNARLLHAPDLRGWNRYTVNLLAELTRRDLSIVLYSDRPLHESHLERLAPGGYRVEVSPRLPYPVWEQRWLPDRCRRDGVDLLHSPFNFGLPWASRCRRVLTLHDAIDQVYRPDDSGPRRVRLSQLRSELHHLVARVRAHRVITVSRHARSDLIRHLRLSPDRIDVVPEAADPCFHRPVEEPRRRAVLDRHGLARPFLFYVGGWERRKNVPFLVQSFAQAAVPGLELVLAGGKAEQRESLTRLAESLGIAESVRFLGWVDEAELPALYAGALGFVYPSEYEGFGLQLCEAMAVGCPVLASEATSLPEVLGDGGATFPLDSTDRLVELIRRLAGDPEFRSDLADRASARSTAFSWRTTADLTLESYRRALESR